MHEERSAKRERRGVDPCVVERSSRSQGYQGWPWTG